MIRAYAKVGKCLAVPDTAVGGVIPPDDIPALLAMGATAVYPPGTVISEAAEGLLEILERR